MYILFLGLIVIGIAWFMVFKAQGPVAAWRGITLFVFGVILSIAGIILMAVT